MKKTAITLTAEHLANLPPRFELALKALLDPSPSRSQIETWLKEGRILINDLPPQKVGAIRLSLGDVIEITWPEPKPLDLTPEDRDLEILFDDDDLLVVNKPPGLTVHPSETQTEGTLVHALLGLHRSGKIKELSSIGGVQRPGIVHRIDKNTSGALVITKTDSAHHALSQAFKEHTIERKYLAFVYGDVDSSPKTVRTLLARHPTDRKRMTIVPEDSPGARVAITHYRGIERYQRGASRPFASLIEAKLETGRTHQVRVHLTSEGHSLLGDPSYGTPSRTNQKWKALPVSIQKAVEELPGQALHAQTLGFKHPRTGEWMCFTAPPPSGFAALQAALEKEASCT